jgi:hypothetical protein
MQEKEEIIKKSNIEKSKLIQVLDPPILSPLLSSLSSPLASSGSYLQENQNLRKALTSSSLQVFHELQEADERIHQLQEDLADAQLQIQKFQVSNEPIQSLLAQGLTHLTHSWNCPITVDYFMTLISQLMCQTDPQSLSLTHTQPPSRRFSRRVS